MGCWHAVCALVWGGKIGLGAMGADFANSAAVIICMMLLQQAKRRFRLPLYPLGVIQ